MPIRVKNYSQMADGVVCRQACMMMGGVQALAE
jgi:hypothetical protein